MYAHADPGVETRMPILADRCGELGSERGKLR